MVVAAVAATPSPNVLCFALDGVLTQIFPVLATPSGMVLRHFPTIEEEQCVENSRCHVVISGRQSDALTASARKVRVTLTTDQLDNLPFLIRSMLDDEGIRMLERQGDAEAIFR